MKTLISIIGGILLLLFLAYVVHGFYNGAKYLAASAFNGFGLTTNHAYAVGGTGPQKQGPYTIDGSVVLDYSHGIPPAPYIVYTDVNGNMATKQLVYMGARACNPNAGDYPCVPPYHATHGYPELADGQRISATGYIYENRFLITSLRPVQ